MRCGIRELIEFPIANLQLRSVTLNFLLRVFAFGDVHDRAEHKHAVVGLDRIQTNFHREFAAVLAQSKQVTTGAHPPRRGRRKKAVAMVRVLRAKPFRNQRFDGPPDQLIAAITERSLRFRVHQNDQAGAVDHDHGCRSRFDRQAKTSFQDLALGDVHHRAEHEHAVVGLDWIQTNLHREFATILTQPKQVAARPHPSRRGRREKAVAMVRVLRAKPLRYQHFHRPSEQLIAAITK